MYRMTTEYKKTTSTTSQTYTGRWLTLSMIYSEKKKV